MRPHVRRIRHVSQHSVDNRTSGPGVQPATASPQQERLTRVGADQQRSTVAQPPVERALGGRAVGHCALLGALSHDTDCPSSVIHIAQVQADQLTDAHAGRVEELEDEKVPDVEGVVVIGRD